MADRAPLLFLCVLLAAPALAGCTAEDDGVAPSPTGPGWAIGDQWTYLRRLDDGPGAVYHRSVAGLTAWGDQTVFEVREGIEGLPLEQTNRYTVGRLRYVGGEVRDPTGVVQSTEPDHPIVYHYLFPLGGSGTLTDKAELQQRSGGSSQLDHVEVQATSGGLERLRLGERVYDVFPYRIEIRFLDTPFAEASIIEGHWAPAVGQSVLTLLHESGTTTRYELIAFTRARPEPGPPAYRLAGDLRSFELTSGFDATLGEGGYARYLFHVKEGTDIGLHFLIPPPAEIAESTQVDLAVLRPLGYTRAGLTDSLARLSDPGVVLHVAAAEEGEERLTLHAPESEALDAVTLLPGQVYELLLASNRGGMRVEVRSGAEVMTREPIGTGQAEVITVQHRHVQEATGPGPQNLRDAVTAIVSVPPDARVEGLVYAINHGGGDGAIGEVEATRRVLLRSDADAAQSGDALYAFYQAHPPRGTFEVEAAFEYRAGFALQGAVDYEIGAVLMRLWDGPSA